ncbi:hypothetical protein [uncultured Jannaschia sp.]|uniref:hypothetical protein n=1 Tax=uncultured Jannaschia sp. TaxID=293347 RepID=UPI0026248CD8|nr:hypothetical protein [uncultured Jannaschia sp.]
MIDEMLDTTAGTYQNTTIGSTPMTDALPQIASTLGYPTSLDLIKAFNYRLDRLRHDASVLDLSRESVRQIAFRRIDEIQKIFDAPAFKRSVNQAFGSYFSQVNLDSIDDLSERLESQHFGRSDAKNLLGAFEVAKQLAELSRSNGNLSPRAKRLISIHIDHLSNLIDSYETHGEMDFWDHYRILFSKFVELHETHFKDGETSKEYKERVNTMLGRLITSSSLAANAITVAPVVVQLLT